MKPKIELLISTLIPDFPSGSSINYYNGKLYLTGDDASHLMILDTDHRKIDAIRLFESATKRIPKSQKADFETATIIDAKDGKQLLVLGSASTDKRNKALLLPLVNTIPDPDKSIQPDLYNQAFFTGLKRAGIKEVNIEGSTVIGNYLVLSNRGNLSDPVNYIIYINKTFLTVQEELSLFTSQLLLPATGGDFTGVSELCYVDSKDILFVALSSEATTNAYDDGAIGDSYIGWINDVTNKIHHPEIALDAMINLSSSNGIFKGEKIEGICVETADGREVIAHLVSDNDLGESRLFKIKVILA